MLREGQCQCPTSSASLSLKSSVRVHQGSVLVSVGQRPYLTNSASMSNQGSVRVQIEQRLCPTSSASFPTCPCSVRVQLGQRLCPASSASLSHQSRVRVVDTAWAGILFLILQMYICHCKTQRWGDISV